MKGYSCYNCLTSCNKEADRIMKKFGLLLTTAFLFNFLKADAAETLSEPMKQLLSRSPEIPGISHIILSTALMVVFIYIMAIAYHKLSAFNNKRFSNMNDKILNLNKLKLVNSMSLGANKSLHVVEINNKFLVLGSTPASINLLKEFDKNPVLDSDFSVSSAFGDEEHDHIIEESMPSISELSSQKSKTKTSAEMDFEKIYKKYL